MTIRSEKMKGIYNSLRRVATDRGHVFLVYRFNKDDEQVGGIFAAPYKEQRETLIQGIKPVNVMKQQITSDKSFKNIRFKDGFQFRHPLRGIERAQNQGGGHAEELFIQFFLAHKLHNEVNHVEIMISRIPCNNVSPSWFTSGPEGNFPLGCGPKLLTLAQRYTNIHWTIAYDEVNTATTNMDKMNQLINSETGNMQTMVEGWQSLEASSPQNYYPNFVIQGHPELTGW